MGYLKHTLVNLVGKIQIQIQKSNNCVVSHSKSTQQANSHRYTTDTLSTREHDYLALDTVCKNNVNTVYCTVYCVLFQLYRETAITNISALWM